VESRARSVQKLLPKADRAESDIELAAAVLRKDRKATAEFVSLYADSIYAYVRHRLIPRFDSVDDIIQEVFVAAWDNLANFRGESSLRAWLLGIAKNKVEDYYRRRIRRTTPLPTERYGLAQLSRFRK
jgi:RNA polymerase sigma-70 factor, ECF subfamily